MSTLRVNTIQNAAGSGDPTISGAAKAWLNFIGTGTVAIRASFNVSSITDNNTGDYTINFATALTDANYSACIGGGSQTGAQTRFFMEQHDAPLRTATQLRIYTLNGSQNLADTSVTCVQVFR